jgi:hypothetical protein
MSQLVARLILAMFTLPFGLCALVMAMFAADEWSRGSALEDEWWYAGAWIITDVFIVAYWLMVWRSVVRWTPERWTRTVIAIIPAIIVTAVAYFFIHSLANDAEPAVLFSGAFAPIMWVFQTVLIWRESPAERTERLRAVGADNIACPLCGYNLTGLTTAQCPECGVKFTLDHLLAAQSKSDQVSLPEEHEVT